MSGQSDKESHESRILFRVSSLPPPLPPGPTPLESVLPDPSGSTGSLKDKEPEATTSSAKSSQSEKTATSEAQKESPVGGQESSESPGSGQTSDGNTTAGEDSKDKCVVCKKKTTNRAKTDKCKHEFCLQCLQQSTRERRECPECDIPITEIDHNHRFDTACPHGC